jgi:ParB/RepB/Spo0J family partition protein
MAKTKREIPNPLDAFVQSGQIGSYQAITQSLFDVQEAAIEDILDSPYQTREKMTREKWRRLVRSLKEDGPKDFISVRAHPQHEGKWQIVAGGHSRRDAAKEAGLTTYPIVVVEWDDRHTGLGTARENLAREDLTPVEEGRLYLLLRRDFGYTQEGLADELGISRDRIKECEAAAKSAPDILEMMQRAKELEEQGEEDRGLRAAKYLRRLDILDDREEGLARTIRAPLHELFLQKRLTTDAIDIATKRLVKAEDPRATLDAILKSVEQREPEEAPSQPQEEDPVQPQAKPAKQEVEPEIQRAEKLTLATRRFRQYITLIGERPPTTEERTTLVNMRREIDAILQRA